ncbi:MAG: hypothetical protein Q8Q09_01980 [Deltaproteobacteria bacterium]|nr:hypothetical protein [Deltaproteobacteria bacterium]
MKPSLEALEALAHRAHGGGRPVPPRDLETLRARYATLDDSLGQRTLAVLFAEVSTHVHTDKSQSTLRSGWTEPPLALRGESPLREHSHESVLVCERELGRRKAVSALVNARAKDLFSLARHALTSLRSAHEPLGLRDVSQLLGALGLASDEPLSEGALAATEGLWQELDPWALRESEVIEHSREYAAKSITWTDRMRSLAQLRASDAVPLGDRAASCIRWVAQVGLGSTLARIAERTERASVDATGCTITCENPGERVTVRGETAPTVDGALSLGEAFGQALALAHAPSAGPESLRWGADRVHTLVFAALVRRLWTSPSFVTRACGVDASQASRVGLAALHAELLRVRRRAVDAQLVRGSLVGERAGIEQWQQRTQRALGAAPDPAWAVHVAAHALDARAEAHTLATMIEPLVFEKLRARYDEDFFRNPRAGEGLAVLLDAMRTQGALAWAKAECASEENPAIGLTLQSATLRRVTELYDTLSRR